MEGLGRMKIALVAMLVAGVLAGAVPAWAHIGLQFSSPVEGELLSDSPGEIRLVFFGSVSAPARVVVTAPDGTELQSGDPRVQGYVVTQQVEPSQQEGSYRVDYTVTAGGHEDVGSLGFTVGSVNTLKALRAEQKKQDAGDSTRWMSVGIVAAALVAAGGISAVAARRRRAATAC